MVTNKFEYKGCAVKVWGSSFSVNNCPSIWLVADNKEEVIKGLIDSIHASVKADMQQQLRNILGVR